jgi:RHS repeat-associated protein
MPSTPQPLAPPVVSMPKGGGAVRGMGEKVSTNPVTGTGALTVPVWTTPGRAGFGPQLSLSYDSGNGNGPFGLGWTLGLPAITRKTDTGLPTYDDQAGADTFVLAGAEDLVPLLETDGRQRRDTTTDPAYVVERFRPRVEGAFARIERWTHESGEVHWRTLSRDNVLNVFGRDGTSRIQEPRRRDGPDRPDRVFSWLLCETRDDRGNAILYDYKAEDGAGVDLRLASERHRGPRDDPLRSANRYLKRVRYGNRTPLLTAAGRRPRHLSELPDAVLAEMVWLFELVLDYGEHDLPDPTPDDPADWDVRPDSFSTYRSGFEVRTNRRCRRLLMFHHVPPQTDGSPGYDGLVRTTDLAYADDAAPPADAPVAYSLLTSVAQTGYRRNPAGGYDSATLPPLDLTYSVPQVHDEVERVDPEQLANLPPGMDGSTFSWTDLDGDGIPGLLSERSGVWFYTRNLSARETGRVVLAPPELIATRPSVGLREGARLVDLAGDGLPDLAVLGGATPGFFERDPEVGWSAFRPFGSLPSRDLRDPEVMFVDLDGDGRADALLADQGGWSWHRCLGEEGFGPHRPVTAAHDEALGPPVVRGGTSESLQLADLSGDGLMDPVRIRNGDVSYWPNLGHGRFGPKVTMDAAPVFDNPEQFDAARVRLADLDGSGTTDIVYLHRDGIALYFNLSGNAWAGAVRLTSRPLVPDERSVHVTDLLGNGTACLAWSPSPAGDGGPALEYVRLLGPDKPHLLVGADNNLGAVTRLTYVPSTRFYLADRDAGFPWRTRLPFPVHVVERVETHDLVGRNRFTHRYAYHDGYFDGAEREFRGFAMVEEWDTEEYAVRVQADGAVGCTLHTRSWFETGGPVSGPAAAGPLAAFREPGTTGGEDPGLGGAVLPAGLRTDELAEARRALKGLLLRQEVYGDYGSDLAELPYTVVERTYEVRSLQLRGPNRHAVFLTHPRESLTTIYERDPHDPRASHVLVLEVDAYGTVTKQADIAYGRRATTLSVDQDGQVRSGPNPGLAELTPADRETQLRTLATYTETVMTEPVDDVEEAPDDLRTPMVCDTTVCELTGHAPTGSGGRFRAGDLVVEEDGELRPRAGGPLPPEAPPESAAARRLVARALTVFRADDLSGLLPYAQLGSRALPGESYRLAMTRGLLDAALQRPAGDGAADDLVGGDESVLTSAGADGCGYVSSTRLRADGRLAGADDGEGWWVPAGQASYSRESDEPVAQLAEAQAHFFAPRRYRDPFGKDTSVRYDEHDLLVLETVDPVANSVVTEAVDYRVLQPSRLRDANGNRAEAAFDVLGLVTATATAGKADGPREGDDLGGIADLTDEQVSSFFDAADLHEPAVGLLGPATTRVVHDLHRFRRTRAAAPDDQDAWQPACTATIARETHGHELAAGQVSDVQVEVSHCDGFGRVVQKKIQAEPGPVVPGGPVVTPRWVGSGWTIHNDKGNPVRRYEPFFSRRVPGHQFEFGATFGVSPVLFYDPAERVVAALNPNHTYTKVRFGPWRTVTYDVNDTSALRGRETGDPRTDPDVGWLLAPHLAALPDAASWKPWGVLRAGGGLGPHEQTAATQAAAHADTPTTTHLDPLGRPFLTVLHNRIAEPGHPDDGLDELLAHRAVLDIQGNRTAVRDGVTTARDAAGAEVTREHGRLVAEVVYDLLGHPLRDASMEAGTRWTLTDVAGNRVRRWDSRGHGIRSSYDGRRRPTHVHVSGLDPADPTRELLCERLVYGEAHPESAAHNLRTTVYLHLDQAGGLVNDGHDFAGNPRSASRRLTRGTEYRGDVDWTGVDDVLPGEPDELLDLGALETFLAARLEDEAFTSLSTYDALHRPRELVTPHSVASAPSRVRHTYSAANLLSRVEVNLHGETADGAEVWTPLLSSVEHDAKGQRLVVSRGNGATTTYAYDPDTFRVVRLQTLRAAGPGSGLQDHRITYDPIGNIVHIEDGSQQPIFFANHRVEAACTYAYDASYQLIRATGREHLGQGAGPTPWSAFDTGRVGVAFAANDGSVVARYTERFRYDAAGNLLETRHASGVAGRDWTRVQTYAEPSQLADGEARWTSNRLTQAAVGAGAEAPSYDEHGNTTRLGHLGDGSPGPNLHWNHQDQLVRVDHGGGGTTYYVYDAAGRRVRTVREKTATLTEERIDLGDVDIYRKRRADALLERETLHVREGHNLLAQLETRTVDTAGDDQGPAQLVRYPLADHLASSRIELDDRARIISYEEYAAFGATTLQAVRSQTETSKRFRFTGHERDESTGLYAMGVRYFASWLGRWISCDPAGVTDSPNRYEYVANNPVRHVDTTGRGLWDKAKAFVSDGVDRATAAVKPNGAVFEAVDSAFKPSEHPVSAAVLNNMAKRGEDLVAGVKQQLKQAGDDYGDIAYSATHLSEPGAKQKLAAAVDRRQKAPVHMAVGMAKGFAHQLKNVGEGLGTVAYYRPELVGLGGVLPSHAKEQGADAKVASAITDIVLDGPQIVLTVEGGLNVAKGGINLAKGSAAAKSAAGALPKGTGSATTMDTALENGATVRHSSTATAIGDDANTLTNFERSKGAAGHDVIVHGRVIEGEGFFITNGYPTHVQQIADAVLANPAYIPGTPIQLVTCYGAVGLAKELSEALGGVGVKASPFKVDLAKSTGLLREWPWES